MSLRANYDKKFFRRFLYVAIGCLAFTGWCFYDAQIKYPKELERAKIYWTKSDDPGEKYEGMDGSKWREVAAEKNWSTSHPKMPDKIEHSIQSQYLYAAICTLIGLPCLFKWFRARGTWVEANETELTTSWGSGFQFKDITSIDKTKWEKKGLANVHHQSNGQPATFVLDDFKFDRATMSKIVESIENGLSDEQITGADREVEINARKAEKEAAKQAAREA